MNLIESLEGDKMPTKSFLFSLLLCFSGLALGHPGHQPPAMPKEFDQLKQLVGTWEGTTMMDGKEQKVIAVYEVTSGGTAVVERLFAGTPEEMVSVFHKEGKSLGMTHYCAIGNQPHMHLKKADGKSMAFEMTKPDGISSMKEAHMHAVTLTMADPDSLKEEWVQFADGSQKGTAAFTLKRKK
jgi:hypothetical protein